MLIFCSSLFFCKFYCKAVTGCSLHLQTVYSNVCVCVCMHGCVDVCVCDISEIMILMSCPFTKYQKMFSCVYRLPGTDSIIVSNGK